MNAQDVPSDAAVPRKSRLRFALTMMLIAFLAGLAVMAWAMHRHPQWFSWLGLAQPAAVQPMPALQPATPEPVQTPALDPQAIAIAKARETELATRVGDLEARFVRIDRSAQAAAGNAARAEGLLVAFAARRAIDRGLGLGYIEAQLRERFGEAQPRAVGMVIAAARSPITLEELQIGLDEIAPQLARGGPGESWWNGLKREAANLIVLRRDGTASPRADQRMTRARRKLAGGQVDGALAEIARMPGQDAASGWITAARRYIEVRRALDVLETAALLEPRVAAPVQPIVPAAETAGGQPAVASPLDPQPDAANQSAPVF